VLHLTLEQLLPHFCRVLKLHRPAFEDTAWSLALAFSVVEALRELGDLLRRGERVSRGDGGSLEAERNLGRRDITKFHRLWHENRHASGFLSAFLSSFCTWLSKCCTCALR
jgi:hypothetical protein